MKGFASGHGLFPVYCLLFTAYCSPLTSSCGTASYFAIEETDKLVEAPQKTDPNIVIIQTGNHSHVFPKHFMQNVALLETTERKNWEQAAKYFEAAQSYPDIDPAAAMYGAFLADLLITADDLVEISTVITKLFGFMAPPRESHASWVMSHASQDRGLDLFPSPLPLLLATRHAPLATIRRHGMGDISHILVEEAMNKVFLDFTKKAIWRLREVVKAPDFMFPIQKFTLGVSEEIAKGASVDLVGYHNKGIARFFLEVIHVLNELVGIVISIRLDSSVLARQVFAGLDFWSLLDDLFAGAGAKTLTTMLNSDPTLFQFYSEHVGYLKEITFDYLRSDHMYEAFLGDDAGHKTADFFLFVDGDGWISFQIRTGQDEEPKSSAWVPLAQWESWAVGGGQEEREAVRRHLDDPALYPYVNATHLLARVLRQFSSSLNRILTEFLLSSLGQEMPGEATSGLLDVIDMLNSLLKVLGGFQLGMGESLLYIDVHRFFEVLPKARDFLPAWTKSPNSAEGYFYTEYECGEREPNPDPNKVISSAGCGPGVPLTDSEHFADLDPRDLGVGIKKIAGLDATAGNFLEQWTGGVPRDGLADSGENYLWQDPGFGGFLWVDGAVLLDMFTQQGGTLPEGQEFPCGIEPKIQVLSGRNGICAFNLGIALLEAS